MYHGERFNTISHLIGTVLSIIGLIALVIFACLSADPWKIVSFSIYGTTLVILYVASTCYHWIKSEQVKTVLQKVDHISIYLLIAGSYTPFTLVTLRGAWGWSLFGVNWGLAIFGIIQELTLGKRTRILSMIIYVVMGWLIVIGIVPLLRNLSSGGLFWLTLGGIIYSVGIYFFINDEKIKHGHGIWHLFVLAGSLCQFFSIILYVR
ncbi:PAQR family membrane homeostasis protein TrhA [Neisseria sp. Ec49-e6-T10]|uniref:PAQR family membrane homeostasis protein TrhA n=1 Tax=Neisseria sp. Ec49-e6-T10 TaxID=3140744 RepID=UPI003EBA05A7